MKLIEINDNRRENFLSINNLLCVFFVFRELILATVEFQIVVFHLENFLLLHAIFKSNKTEYTQKNIY